VPCYSPLKGWKDRDTGGIVFRREYGSEKMEVACGQCLGCRLDRSRLWAMRIVHESSVYEHRGGNCFITLTYRPRRECTPEQLRNGFHVPNDWSLHKTHFQKFMKRLRKAFPKQKIKFFMCGEYGRECQHGFNLDEYPCFVCNNGRPHYHACLFNCTFPDLIPYDTQNGETRYTSPFLESIWKYGFVDVGEVNFDSAAYVARYILKKVTGPLAEEHYWQLDEDGEHCYLTPEYCSMSRGARKGARGIGYDFYEQYKNDMFPHDEVPVPGRGVFKLMPRYYEEIFKEENPLSMEEIKAVRQEFMRRNKHEYTPERLYQRYKVKKDAVSMLKRSVK